MNPAMSRAHRIASPALVFFTLLAAAVLAAGCSDDSEETKSPAVACTDMCTKAGFSSGRADVQPHELNCFCTGAGTVTPAACTEMCSSQNKKGSPFTSGQGVTSANACQCQ